MAAWTHAICVACWKLRNGEREPVRAVNSDSEKCCFCGKLTDFGIYVRYDPRDAALVCKGEHE